MIKYYKLLTADTFGRLEVGKIYPVKNNRFILNQRENAIMYGVTSWQLENMFQEVKK